MHPIETTTSLFNAVLHPVDTTKMLADAISESYERDVINGDTVSQASWITYAIGSIAGTKGAGHATKSASTAGKSASAATKSTNIKMPNLPPLGPQYQFATGGPIPYNVVDGVNLRDQMITKFSKHFTDSKKTKLKPKLRIEQGNLTTYIKLIILVG